MLRSLGSRDTLCTVPGPLEPYVPVLKERTERKS